jgi:hypothetical protein
MRIWLLFIVMALTFNLYSNDYIKTLEVGKKWTYTRPMGLGNYQTFTYYLTCDTVINDKKYYIISNFRNIVFTRAYIREDTILQMIYLLEQDSLKEKILINYNLNINDTFVTYTGFNLVVDSVSNSYKFGQQRKIIHFDEAQKFFEGIGYSFNGVILTDFYSYVKNVESTPSTCNNIINSIGISKNNEWISFFPNPVYQKLFFKYNQKMIDVNVRIYNMDGQIVLNTIVKNNELDISHLSNGNYLIELSNMNNITVQKLIKK